MMQRVLAISTLFALAAGGLWIQAEPKMSAPEVVVLPLGGYAYRPAGEYRIGNQIVDAPVQDMTAPRDLQIMKHQVTEAEYQRCTNDGACPELAGVADDFAQTGVNFADALAYSDWFSHQTGQTWRLPTDAEWMRGAKGRVIDAALPVVNDGDPSRRWLASYRREAALRGTPDAVRYSIGRVAESDFGVADMAGNVWEWTQSCLQKGTIAADGKTITEGPEYCGVRAVQGKHRAFVIDFVRDTRSGGCGAGVPPDYLGFRLVHEI